MFCIAREIHFCVQTPSSRYARLTCHKPDSLQPCLPPLKWCAASVLQAQKAHVRTPVLDGQCAAITLQIQSGKEKGLRHKPNPLILLVRSDGVEPPTYWFVASCSIQLSYERVEGVIYS